MCGGPKGQPYLRNGVRESQEGGLGLRARRQLVQGSVDCTAVGLAPLTSMACLAGAAQHSTRRVNWKRVMS